MGITRIKYTSYINQKNSMFLEKLGKLKGQEFVLDNDNANVYKNLLRWAHGDPEFEALDPETRKPIKGKLNKGIYLCGNIGTGKSWALELISDYIRNYGIEFYSNLNKIPMQFQSIRTDGVCDIFIEQGLVSSFKNRKIICFQDFASDCEPLECNHYGTKVKVIQSIIEARSDKKGTITLMSSNIPIDNKIIRQRYGERVQSRLYKMFNYMELTGKDRRKY